MVCGLRIGEMRQTGGEDLAEGVQGELQRGVDAERRQLGSCLGYSEDMIAT